MRAKINVIKRSDHVGNREPRKIESETFRAQVGGLNIFVDRAVEVRQQAAERHLALPLRLPQGLSRACLAEVIGQPALDRFPQAKFPVKRHVRDARRAARIGALHLHAWDSACSRWPWCSARAPRKFSRCRCFAPCGRKEEVARPACPAIDPDGGPSCAKTGAANNSAAASNDRNVRYSDTRAIAEC